MSFQPNGFQPDAIQTGAISPASGVTHATSGALTGQGSSVVGAASSATTRPSSGVLAGQGAALDGAASRFRAHATTGVLAGPGSAIVGAASSATTRTSAGVLVGPGAVIAGAASSATIRASSGVLVGPGAVIVGAAALVVPYTGPVTRFGEAGYGVRRRAAYAVTGTHDASGVLAGSGATLSGSAARSVSATVITRLGEAGYGVRRRTPIAVSTSHDTTGALVGSGAEIDGAARIGGGGWLPGKIKKRKFLITIRGKTFRVDESELEFWLAKQEEAIVDEATKPVKVAKKRGTPVVIAPTRKPAEIRTREDDGWLRSLVAEANRRVSERFAAYQQEVRGLEIQRRMLEEDDEEVSLLIMSL